MAGSPNVLCVYDLAHKTVKPCLQYNSARGYESPSVISHYVENNSLEHMRTPHTLVSNRSDKAVFCFTCILAVSASCLNQDTDCHD